MRSLTPLNFSALPAPHEVTRPCGCCVRVSWRRIDDHGASYGPPEQLVWCDQHRVDGAQELIEQLQLFGGAS